MSRARVAVLQVVSQQRSVTAAAAEYGFSRRHLHRLLVAYREGGLDALEPRSRRPKTNAAATSVPVRERVIALRSQLTADGLDAGPVTIATANGSDYTSRFTGGRNAFDYLLPVLGIRQKNGSPGHPQTQGKIERLHQTLKRWLAARPTAASTADLQHQLDEFRDHYNEQRPHRALDRHTPGQAYRAIPKALPAAGRAPTHYRIRYDRLDTKGKMSIRRAGRMHHLGVGIAHTRARVLALADEHQITVIELHTGKLLSTHLIDPKKVYWRNQEREPGRWPSSPK